jgi:hypothetical protein
MRLPHYSGLADLLIEDATATMSEASSGFCKVKQAQRTAQELREFRNPETLHKHR